MDDQIILRVSATSSSSTSTNGRDDGFRSCNVDSNQYMEDGYNRKEGDVEIEFAYQVEIDTETLSFGAERKVFDILSEEVVKSIHATYCGDGDDDGGGILRRRRLHFRRTLLNQIPNTIGDEARIDAIASGSFASTISTKDSCEPHVLESLACNRYKGTVIVGYSTGTEDEDGTNNEAEIVDRIENTVLDRISDDMTNNRYLLTINDDLLKSENEFKVTRILFEGLDFFEPFKDDQDEVNGFNGDRQFISQTTTQDDTSLTQLGKVAVVWIGVLFLTMMFAFFSMHRSFRKSRHRTKEDQATIVASTDDENDARRAKQNESYMHRDDDSFVSIECRNLGRIHNEDVQHCNQPDCPACSCRGRLQRIEEESKEASSENSLESPVTRPAELLDQKKTLLKLGFFTRKPNMPPVEVFHESAFEDEPSTITIDKRISPSRKSVSARTLNLRLHSNRSTFRWLFPKKSTNSPPPIEGTQEELDDNDDPPGVKFVKVDDPLTGFRMHSLSGKLAAESQLSSLSSAGNYLGQLSSNSGEFTSDSHSSKRKRFKSRRVDMSGNLMSFEEKVDSPTDEERYGRIRKPTRPIQPVQLWTSHNSAFEPLNTEIDSKTGKDSGKPTFYSQHSMSECHRIIVNAIKEADSLKLSAQSQAAWPSSTTQSNTMNSMDENDSGILSTHSNEYLYTTQRIEMHDMNERSPAFYSGGNEKSVSARRSGSPFRTRTFGQNFAANSKPRRIDMLGECPEQLDI